MVICLEQGANDLHMVQLMPLPPIISCSSKIKNGLPFWCRLTQVVLEKRPLNRYSSSSYYANSSFMVVALLLHILNLCRDPKMPTHHLVSGVNCIMPLVWRQNRPSPFPGQMS